MKKLSLITTLLLVLFIGLKLSHVINWSWLWTLSPYWIPCLISIIVFIVFLIITLRQYRKDKKNVDDLINRRTKWQQKVDEIYQQRKMNHQVTNSQK